jgi:hypothetical protein
LLQNGDVGIGVLPECEEIIVGEAGFGSVALQSVGSGKAQMSVCAGYEIHDDGSVIEDFLERRGCLFPLP